MNDKLRVLMLLGSPKKSDKSASFSIGSALLSMLEKRGAQTSVFELSVLANNNPDYGKLIESVKNSDVILFASPLYEYSMPFFVIKAMDAIKHNLKVINGEKSIFVISNCGFPCARDNELAIKIYRQFASEAGFGWLGGLSVGMGQVAKWRIFDSIGMSRIKRGLTAAADSILSRQPITDEAYAAALRPMVPVWFFVLMYSFATYVIRDYGQ